MLFRDEKDEQQKRSSNDNFEFYADTMEKEKSTEDMGFINRQKGAFANADSGLNKEPGVFNKSTLFFTGQ